MLYNNLPKLVQTGVDFLSNEEIKDDSAVEKLQFLIQKGLTDSEILQALEIFNLKQEKMTDVISGVDYDYLEILRGIMLSDENKKMKEMNSEQFYALPPLPPPPPTKDWKDVFIMASATSGIAYGLYHLMNEFILPKIMPKSDSDLEKDKNEVQDNFNKIGSKLEEFDSRYNDSVEKESGKMKQLEDIIRRLNRKIDDLEEEKHRIRQDFKLLQSDLKSLTNTFNVFIDKNDTSRFLEQMQKEIRGLNNILEYKLENQQPALTNQINDKTNGFGEKASSISFSNLTRPLLLDNGLPIPQLPSATEIFAKMNLQPVLDNSSKVIDNENDSNNAIKNEIENISVDLS